MGKIQSDTYNFKLLKPEELSDTQKMIIEQAEKASEASHSPYSNFKVGAALLLEDGTIIKGSNQENASYPAGLCAERVAFFQAGAVHPNKNIHIVAVIARKGDELETKGAAPCGSCRQVMLEYEVKQDSPIEILFKMDNGWVLAESSKLLLPFCFNKNNL